MILKVKAYDLTCTKISNGTYYVTTDTKQIFYDSSGVRNIISVLMIDTEHQRLNNVAPQNGSKYYVWETNTLWTYNNKWIVIEGNYTSYPSGYVYVNNFPTPSSSDPTEVLDNNGLLRDGSVVVRDTNRIIKGKIYISNGDTVYRYVLLTTQPDDWSTNYTDYYVYVGGGEYETNSDSTWAADTYYKKETATTSVNDLVISSFLGGGIKLLPSGSMDSTGALQIFSANTYTGQFDNTGNPVITGNDGELVFWGDMYVTDGTNRFKVLTSRDGYTYVAGEGIVLGNTDIYILLLVEPTNWNTNYTDYYTESGGVYSPNTNPTWADDTYYVKETVPNSIAVQDYSALLKGVQINGTDLSPDANNKVNIPKASANDLGVVKIGSGISIDSDGAISAASSSTTLGGLTDVTLTTPSNGQVLKYDSVNSIWVNGNETTPSIDVDDLTDVTITSLQDGQILKYDSSSSEWVNANEVTPGDTVSVSQIQTTGTQIATITVSGTPTTIYAPTGGGSSSLSGLSDVTITTPVDGQILKYKTLENTNTASGSIANFETNISVPLKTAVFNFTPNQSAGTPAPSNPIPIYGHTGLNVVKAGKNLIPIPTETMTSRSVDLIPQSDGTIKLDGTATGGTAVFDIARSLDFYLPAGTYFVNETSSVYSITVYSETNGTATLVKSGGGSFTLSERKKIFVRIGVANGTSTGVFISLQLELGNTATTFVPYTATTYPISWSDTVYGGYVNEKGEVWATRAKDTFDGDSITSLNTSGSVPYARVVASSLSTGERSKMISNQYVSSATAQSGNIIWVSASQQVVYIYDDRFTDLETAKTLLNANPVTLVYPLATPVKIATIDPIVINTLLGVNNIYNDGGGDTNVEFVTGYSDNWENEANSLTELSDINVTTPTDGQMLSYDNANSKWVNANVPKELPTVTSADEGKFLTVDGNGSWVATTISAWNGGNF